MHHFGMVIGDKWILAERNGAVYTDQTHNFDGLYMFS